MLSRVALPHRRSFESVFRLDKVVRLFWCPVRMSIVVLFPDQFYNMIRSSCPSFINLRSLCKSHQGFVQSSFGTPRSTIKGSKELAVFVRSSGIGVVGFKGTHF